MTNSNNQRPLFYFIAALLPIALFVFLEIGLRLSGFGQTIPLFVQSDQFPDYLQPNPRIIERYFSSSELAPNVSPDTVYFQTNKQDDVFRIVIQGGSSAAGFPFGRFGSLQGMLEQRFKRTYPNQKIEIINTAMAAVNSYTLLDFADEIIAIKPDLILVYTGHNEYLGILGVGSAYASKGGRAATLAYLLVKDLAIFQAAQTLYLSFKKDDSVEVSSTSTLENKRSLMSKVAKGKEVQFGSEKFEQGLQQFEGNLSALITKYQQANIPVMLGNLVSIEKGLVPFSAVNKATESSLQQDSAGEKYNAAELAYEQHQFSLARNLYKQARDYDSLRFRAPSQFNLIIEDLAQKQGVFLVDVESKIYQETPDKLIGKKHLLEHVHPTARGYFLMAEAFYEKISVSNLIGPPQVDFPADRAWQEIPITTLDKKWAQLKIERLTSDYPFPPSFESPLVAEFDTDTFTDDLTKARLAGESWLTLQQQLIQNYASKNDFRNAALVAGIISDALPMSAIAANNAAKYHRLDHNYDLSVYYQTKAIELDLDNSNYLLNQAHTLFLKKNYSTSLSLIDKAEQLGADKSKVNFFRNKVQQASNEGSR